MTRQDGSWFLELGLFQAIWVNPSEITLHFPWNVFSLHLMNNCVESAQEEQSPWQYQLYCICRWGFKILCSRQYLQQASKRLLHYLLVCMQNLSLQKAFYSICIGCLNLNISGKWLNIIMWISKGKARLKKEARLAQYSCKPAPEERGGDRANSFWCRVKTRSFA